MDLDQLRAFVYVARFSSFSLAAQQLGLAQPTMSRQVQQLEREVGVRMIDRERRPIALTPAGQQFLSFAEATVNGLDSAIRQIRFGQIEIEGPIMVVASTTPGEFLVPALLASFTARHPKVRPSLVVTDSAGAARELLARRADAAFLGAPLIHPQVRLVPFREDEIVLAVPIGHRFSQRGAIALADLSGEPLVEREGGSGTLDSLRRLLEQQGLRMPEHQVTMVAGSTQAQLAAIEAGVGLGFVSSLALANQAHRGVFGVRIEEVSLKRALYLAYVPSSLSPVAESFVQSVTEAQE